MDNSLFSGILCVGPWDCKNNTILSKLVLPTAGIGFLYNVKGSNSDKISFIEPNISVNNSLAPSM